MDKITLRKVQLTQLEIAKEVHRVCEKNNIKYFLDSGTLLGAIRHKGFIPWDDDLDIGMIREEYEKFIKVAPIELNEKYVLQVWGGDNHYALPFAKIRNINTVYVENKSQKSQENQGIYIDIFPYDRYGNNKVKQGFPLRLAAKMVLAKEKMEPWLEEDKINFKRYLVYLPLRVMAMFVTKRKLVELYEKKAKMYNGDESLDYFENGSSPYGKWVIAKECISEVRKAKFESVEFNVPIDDHSYLKGVYGDYMKLPPVDKRENRHQIVTVKFEGQLGVEE